MWHGTAYGSRIDSEHLNSRFSMIAPGPERFDPLIDFLNSKRPGPATYSPKVKPKKTKGSAKQDAIRMKDKFYETVSPGPGSYRFQSEFGIYSPDDAKNEVEVNEINQAAATQRGSLPDQFFSPRNMNLQSAKNKNFKIPLSSSTGFNTEKKAFSQKKHFL